LELVEGVRRYRCRIDLKTGQARLTRTDDLAADPENSPEIEMAKAQTSLKEAGRFSFRFANVDDRLCLWINEGLLSSGFVSFGAGAEFDSPANHLPQDADLTPVGVAAVGASVVLSDLVIERDIYYRADRVNNDAGNFMGSSSEVDENLPLHDLLKDPKAWGDLYEMNSRRAEFEALGPDEFFVMGDNSPRSQDSRLWPNQVRRATNRHAVDRKALIGKAFFIYWPHGIPFLNEGRGFKVRGHKPIPQAIQPNMPNWMRDQIAKEWRESNEYPEYVAPFYPQWDRWKRIR